MTSEDLDREIWLANRLRVHGVNIFEGDTTTAIRMQRAREGIARIGSEVAVGRGRDGKPVNYAQAFEALYREPLAQPQGRPSTRTEAPNVQSIPDGLKA